LGLERFKLVVLFRRERQAEKNRRGHWGFYRGKEKSSLSPTPCLSHPCIIIIIII